MKVLHPALPLTSDSVKFAVSVTSPRTDVTASPE